MQRPSGALGDSTGERLHARVSSPSGPLLAGCDDHLDTVVAGLGDTSQSYMGNTGGLDNWVNWHARPPMNRVAALGESAVLEQRALAVSTERA